METRTRNADKLSKAVFWTTQVLAQTTGVALLITIGIWVSRYSGGFNWGKSPGTFSYHAFFGITGLVFVCGEAILFAEIPKRLNLSAFVQKAVHATIHSCALLFTIVSLSAAIANKNIRNSKHLYSLHSWLGVGAILLFFLQYSASCVLYGVARRVGDWLTDLYKKTHAFFGLFTFVLGIATCLTGFMEVVVEDIGNYQTLPIAAVLANLCCIWLVVFGGSVAYCATRSAANCAARSGAGSKQSRPIMLTNIQ